MNFFDFLCMGAGVAGLAGIFLAGFIGEQARILELDLAIAGGAL